MPAEFLSVAEPGGLVAAIDNLLLFRCVQIVRRLAKQDRKVGIFCNISLARLGDEDFFPQFLEFMADNRDLAGALIFELGQAAFDARGAIEARNMAKLADLGFRFSIDKVTDLDFNFQDLARADVTFVKVAADAAAGPVAGRRGPPDAALVPRPGRRRLRSARPPPRRRAGGREGRERAPGGRRSRPRHRATARATCSASRARSATPSSPSPSRPPTSSRPPCAAARADTPRPPPAYAFGWALA